MVRSSSVRSGFTLIEILVVIAILGLLAALLLTAIGSARFKAQESVCISNLKQLHVALMSYVTNNNGYLPHTDADTGSVGPKFCWFDKIDDHWTDDNESRSKQCPLWAGLGGSVGDENNPLLKAHSYKMNDFICWNVHYPDYENHMKAGNPYPLQGQQHSGYFFFPYDRCKKKRQTVLLFGGRTDGTAGKQPAGVKGHAEGVRHDGKTVILYFAGNVERYDAQEKGLLKANGLGWNSYGDVIWNPVLGIEGK